MAGTVLWHVTMSLDGFIAGPDHEMEWARGYGGPNEIAEDVMATTGAVLAGRGWYDVAMARYEGRHGIYGGRWSGPVFVLTHRPPEDPEDEEIAFLSSGVEGAVAIAREAAGGKNLEIFGADVARQCLDAGLLDEIVVHVAPLLLGNGVRLYGGPGFGQVQLERTAAAEARDLTSARYRVVK